MPQVRLTGKINPVTGEPEAEVVAPKRNNLSQSSGTSDSDLDNSGSTGGTKNSGVENNVANNVANNYSASNNQAYYDATKAAKQTNYTDSVAEAQGESEAKMNSGTGASAAVGTSYSWENKSKELAENAYQQKALEEKQNMLTQRQEMEKNTQQYQTQADMQKYSDNQTAEKVGWTGGYVLDQEKQREYMKQSIQAQLYGAMELQKYGYDTAMAAARLSYDANLLTYAQEYYNQAVQNSLNEAQITGVYFSAEVKDMLSQYTIADAKLEDSSLSEEERTRAQKVKDTIDNWFSENNISKAGIKTLEAWNAEQSLELQWTQELWTQYNAALQAIKEDVNKQTTFIALDENGNPMYDGTTVKTMDMENMSNKDLAEYAKNSVASSQQVSSYINYLKNDIINNNAIRDSSNNVIGYNQSKLETELNQLQKKVNEINKEIEYSSNKIEFNIDDIKGNLSIKKTADNTYKVSDGSKTKNSYSFIDSNGNNVSVSATTTTKVAKPQEGKAFRAGGDGSYQSTSVTIDGKTYNICTTSAIVTAVDDPDEKNFDQDDIAVQVFDSDDSTNTGSGGTYGMEIANDAHEGGFLWWGHRDTKDSEVVLSYENKNVSNFIDAWYKQNKGSAPASGTIIVVNGDMFMYNNGKPYTNGGTGWLKLDVQAGGKGLKGTLQAIGQWVD